MERAGAGFPCCFGGILHCVLEGRNYLQCVTKVSASWRASSKEAMANIFPVAGRDSVRAIGRDNPALGELDDIAM